MEKPETFSEINEILEYPSGIYIADSLLIIVEDNKKNDLIYVFNLSNTEFIASFGDRKEGPKEFTIAPTILQPELISKPILELYDWEKKRNTAYNFNALLNDTSVI